MSLRVIRATIAIERSDDFNEARLLLLLRAVGTEENRASAIDGIMKLAKMDFLLRYPEALGRALECIGRTSPEARIAGRQIPDQEKQTIEAKMIRFRYGPWDWGYRRWLRIMMAKGLALLYRRGATVKIELTEKGKRVAETLATLPEFKTLVERARAVNLAIGSMQATESKEFIYKIVPELNGLKWGEEIRL